MELHRPPRRRIATPRIKLVARGPLSIARAFTDGSFGLRVVLGIDSLGAEPTYDLNVTKDHNSIADGVVVHNKGLVAKAYGQA